MFGSKLMENVPSILKALFIIALVVLTGMYTRSLNDREISSYTETINGLTVALNAKEEEVKDLKKDIALKESIDNVQKDNIKLHQEEVIVIVEKKEEAKKQVVKDRVTIVNDTTKTDQQKHEALEDLDYDYLLSSYCTVNASDKTCEK